MLYKMNNKYFNYYSFLINIKFTYLYNNYTSKNNVNINNINLIYYKKNNK